MTEDRKLYWFLAVGWALTLAVLIGQPQIVTANEPVDKLVAKSIEVERVIISEPATGKTRAVLGINPETNESGLVIFGPTEHNACATILARPDGCGQVFVGDASGAMIYLNVFDPKSRIMVDGMGLRKMAANIYLYDTDGRIYWQAY